MIKHVICIYIRRITLQQSRVFSISIDSGLLYVENLFYSGATFDRRWVCLRQG